MTSTSQLSVPLLLGQESTTDAGPSGAADQIMLLVQRKLIAACLLCVVFLVVEVIGGYLADSIAIMSDAAHMLSDVSSFLVSLFAIWAVTKRSHSAYSFGYHRAEILGALTSILLIWAITGALVWEAIWRVIQPTPVNGKLMFIVASIGVLFNIIIMLILGEHHTHHGGCSHKQDGHSCSVPTVAATSSGVSKLTSHGEDQHPLQDPAHHNATDHHCNHHIDSAAHAHHIHSPQPNTGSNSHHHHHHDKTGACCAIDAEAGAEGSNHLAPNGNHRHVHFSDHGEGHENGNDHQLTAGGTCDHAGTQHQAHAHSKHHHHHQPQHEQQYEEAAHDHQLTPADVSAMSGSAGPEYNTVVAVPPEVSNVPAPAVLVLQHIEGKAQPHSNGPSRVGTAPVPSRTCGHNHGNDDHDHDHAHDDHGRPGEHAHEHGAHDGGHDACGHHRGHHDHGHDHGHGHGDNINMRGAVLHALGDLLQSLGVALAGALIWWHQDDPRWQLADPICTFLFSILVLLTTRAVLRDIYFTLMERSPMSINISKVIATMNEMDGVQDVHDLHVWNISLGLPILTAHVHIGPDAGPEAVLKQLETYVQSLGIRHSTIQICNPVAAALEGELAV